MPVYRWEHPATGKGPYTSHNMRSDAVDEMVQIHNSDLHRWPGISTDDKMYVHPSVRTGYGSVYIDDDWHFGFESLAQMNRWFSPVCQLMLLNSGFKLIRIPDCKVEILVRGVTQIAYRKVAA